MSQVYQPVILYMYIWQCKLYTIYVHINTKYTYIHKGVTISKEPCVIVTVACSLLLLTPEEQRRLEEEARREREEQERLEREEQARLKAIEEARFAEEAGELAQLISSQQEALEEWREETKRKEEVSQFNTVCVCVCVCACMCMCAHMCVCLRMYACVCVFVSIENLAVQFTPELLHNLGMHLCHEFGCGALCVLGGCEPACLVGCDLPVNMAVAADRSGWGHQLVHRGHVYT